MRLGVPPRARAHLIANPRQPCAEAAAALGVKLRTIYDYRHQLIREGAMPAQRPTRRDVADILVLADRVECGEHPLLIAAQATRASAQVMRARLRYHGMPVSELRASGLFLTLVEVARLFGYTDGYGRRVVTGWAQAGHLAALPRYPRAGSRARLGLPWRFTVDALYAFLNDPATWHLWAVERITDPDWREYAADARDRAHLRQAERRGRPKGTRKEAA